MLTIIMFCGIGRNYLFKGDGLILMIHGCLMQFYWNKFNRLSNFGGQPPTLILHQLFWLCNIYWIASSLRCLRIFSSPIMVCSYFVILKNQVLYRKLLYENFLWQNFNFCSIHWNHKNNQSYSMHACAHRLYDMHVCIYVFVLWSQIIFAISTYVIALPNFKCLLFYQLTDR